ncbi:hypothetical protein C3432_22960 [Citrobacter amalonaticus]|uniref:Uncharacterized protein n=2 Tax=Citrobacter amalonaticus TaxID=35703 RepID=A0A2S4S4B6_CITAM|nr:hypothetical protein C3432_22960 [Citrobacter amalonaticus]POT78313.1 hypothetical protein C3436_07335 [Citrobacter amalonaticus]POU68704.1 hypothetical protein C3430_00870 [Citrobacter amalonaticus]POV08307.1 hypothetical protein C3424_00880 [Citrobacter amalonaticus]
MGFPSPAKDYIEHTLTIETICGVTVNSLVIETSQGFAVIERGLKPTPDSTYLISYSGGCHFAKRRGGALITVDGEVLEGEVLDEVDVKGILTHLINWAADDDSPVI